MLNLPAFNSLRGDLYGGLTAAVVALPLALAFGVSSGAGAVAGLYGAVCVGLFAALFGGTPAQVSGPTGPMTVVMAGVMTQFMAADPERGPLLAFTVVMMAGALQILFGLLRLGNYITLVPFPVISGFMSGIGVIIILLQLPPLFGYPAAAGVADVVGQLPHYLAGPGWPALLLGLAILALQLCYPRRLAALLPSPLAALLLGSLVAYWILPEGSLAVIGEIPSGLPSLVLPQFSLDLLQQMLVAALMLAALGSIDSLLTSLVADNMSKVHHDSDRELIGQGVGNVAAGLLGGLPGAGATMRTVVNIRAGGRSALSGVVHALALLLIVLGAGPLAEQIPHAVLAGILVKVGLDIIDWNFLRRLHRAPLFVVGLMLLVLVLTVFVDLITAVVVGVFLANVITVKRLSDTQLDAIRVYHRETEQAFQDLAPRELEILRAAEGRLLLYQFNGPVSYAAARGIRRKLADSQGHEALLLDFSRVPLIDVTTAMAIEELLLEADQAGRQLYLVGMNPVVTDIMTRMRVLRLVPEGHCIESRAQALEDALQKLIGA
ncbi:SulP family inorganic anion transporter [Marinobacterium arenosum]|uniref:SulP family inorganic anion transporter n=1 Tax=Marinobacterium arenosum TaxID=2862496 RepID=UPI001C96FA94|nr:SulP family inorganic anion transporter [Marinobacterium arenosum]MBY4677799.1 SulP family inorganic anion transporter [Marinobacterium arenosum]